MFYNCSARARKLPVHVNHAGVARLDGPELRVITNLRNGRPNPVEQIHYALSLMGLTRNSIYKNLESFWFDIGPLKSSAVRFVNVSSFEMF
jgi:hypothetical protein